MSKEKDAPAAPPPPKWIAPPSDYATGEEEIGDIEAYWDSASPDRNHKDGMGPGTKYGHAPIEFIPLYVTLIDSDMQNDRDTGTVKTSTLLHGKLLKPAVLRNADKKHPKDEEFPAGTIVGIWTKAGLRDIKKMAGAHVWLSSGKFIRGEMQFFKQIGERGQPMVLFTVKPNPKGPEGKPIEVKNDFRKESLPEYQREKRDRLRKAREEAAPVDFDDIPF